MRQIHTLNSKSAAVKKRLDHPVIDADAHVLECEWALMDYVRDIGGPELAARIEKGGRPGYTKQHRSMFWAAPSGKYTIDRATCMLPKLYAERLEDAGIDFAVVYTTYGISANQIREDEIRQVMARSLNTLYAEMFDEVKDRMTPSAVVPTWTPKEAMDELDYAATPRPQDHHHFRRSARRGAGGGRRGPEARRADPARHLDLHGAARR